MKKFNELRLKLIEREETINHEIAELSEDVKPGRLAVLMIRRKELATILTMMANKPLSKRHLKLVDDLPKKTS